MLMDLQMVEVAERRPDGSTFTVYPAAFFYKVRYETDTIDTTERTDRTEGWVLCAVCTCLYWAAFCVLCVVCVLCVYLFMLDFVLCEVTE